MANNLATFKEILNEQTMRAQIQNSLQDKSKSGQFLSSLIDLYNSDRQLQACEPRAVAMECIKAASLNLPINKSLGFAYVVAYKNRPTFLVGYKGLIQLAQRTGQYRFINADKVYEGELKGFNKLTGMADMSGERISDKVVGYFAYFQLINGAEKMLYMSKAECEAWRDKYSPAAKSSYSPWSTEFDKMAIKTCLRRLISTYGIMSTEMQQVISSEMDQEATANANKVSVQLPEAGPAPVTVDGETGEIIEEDDLP